MEHLSICTFPHVRSHTAHARLAQALHATQQCIGARSNKIMDPEVPHALRLQGILVGERPAKQGLHMACLTLFASCWKGVEVWHA